MSLKMADIIQWVSIAVTITGVSLDQAFSGHRLISDVAKSLVFAALVAFVLAKFKARDPNRFLKKEEVTNAWGAMLTRADHSVDVFAGDVSWAQSHRDALSERVQAGVVIRVLCRWPTTPRLIEQVRALIRTGVHVRFYSDDLVKMRGMVADAGIGVNSGTALAVTKTPKHNIRVDKGLSGNDSTFDYEARRYMSDLDGAQISTMQQLFEFAWDGLPEGMILSSLETDETRLCLILSQIEQYKNIKAKNVTLQRVSLDQLYSCCRTVKLSKLERSQSLIEAYRMFELEPFEPCVLEHGGKRSTLLPPIVEQQPNGSLVVIDGMHRIYQLATRTGAQQMLCLVIESAGSLPSTPLPFRDVRAVTTKLPRTDNFPNYDHSNFRDIKAIDRYLATL